MELRKEVILFLATLGILVLMFVTGAQDPLPARLPRSKPAEFVPPQLPPSAVVREDAPAIERGARDLFLKPSATRPLPPLELELPTMQPLPVQLPAIQPGPVLAKGYLQRVVLTELPTEPTASSATSGGGAGEGMGESSSEPATGGSGEEEPRSAVPAIAAGSTQAVEEADYSDEYDRITLTNGRQIWGQTRGEDPYAYGQPDEADVWALTGPFRKAVSFQTYRPEKGTAGITNPWPAGDVQRVEFAKRIGNKIALMQRRIPEDDTGLSQRTAFVLDLLENYRDVEDALVEAEKQAKRHIELAPSNASGYELLAFVYHATGQYEKELEFYDGLANGEFAGAAFVHVGRAAVARKLGMDELAREELMRATQVDSGYARGWLMLAQIALDAGSSAEAVDFAQRAVSRRAPGAPKRISLEIDRIYVQALIADARFEEAQTRLVELENKVQDPLPLQLALLRMLRGAVELGLGKFAQAKASFEEAATANPRSAEAALGACVASIRLGDRAAARSHAESAAERNPVARGRALAAQAVLLSLEDRKAEAISRLGEAREISPEGAYVLYFLGRTLREVGEVAVAREVLGELLQDRSDFLEAMAERALATMQLGRAEWQNDMTNALLLYAEAERFAARVAREEADRARNAVYLDLLGTIRYHKLDNEGAKRAFRQSIEWKPAPYAKLMLALVAYRQGYTDNAIRDLITLTQEIRDPRDAYRKYAQAARDRIIDHRGKRLFTDDFERDLGEVWLAESRHQAKWVAVDERLQIKGRSDGDQRVARCRYTVDQARNFLEVSATITLLPEHTARRSILRLTEVEGSGVSTNEPRFMLQVGYDRAKRGAYVYFHENRARTKKNISEIALGDEGYPEGLRIETGKPFHVVVRRLGAESGQGPGATTRETIVVLIDGREVLRRDMSQAFGLRNRPLAIDFHVSGTEGSRLDTAFDDFRLIRYGEG